MKFRIQQTTASLGFMVLLCLPSAIASGQEPLPRVESQDQLIFALISASRNDESSGTALLNGHKEFITPYLWQQLVGFAESAHGSAPAIYHFALQVARELRDQRLIASTYYKIGWHQFHEGNIPRAIENCQRSRDGFERAGLKWDLIYVLADLGTLYSYASDYQRAREFSEQSLALFDQLKNGAERSSAWPDEYGAGAALRTLGNISKREGDYDKALERLQKSLALYRRIDAGRGKYNTDIIDDLADIGRTYLAMGDYVRALTHLDRAMILAKASRNANREASICNSLGILYTSQRDYAKAIQFFQQGLQLATDVNDRFNQANMLLNIGVAHQFQRSWDQALKSFALSQEIARVIDDKETLILLGEGMGGVYKEQGRLVEALDALNKSLTQATVGGDKTRIAELLWRKAEVQHVKGNYAEAISAASEAARLAEQLRLRNVRYLALTTLGKVYRASKQDQLAAETFSTAISGIEEMRGRVVGLEQENEIFFEDKVAPYHEMVDLLLVQQTPSARFEALRFAERAKGRVLLDVLNRGRVDLASAMTAQEKLEDRRLNKEIAALNIQLTEEGSKKTSDGNLLPKP